MDNKSKTKQTVYISYNKRDSRICSFISYLVAALYRQGIDAVYDKTDHHLDSNRFSNINLFVVVFSKSCALSVACVENLVKLLEFVQEKGHVVVPVFYDSVVAQPLEMFCEAFAALKKAYSEDQVAKWQRALAQTMKLPGHAYTDELRGDSEFIEIIVKYISEKFHPTEHIGIHSVLQELQNLLCKQPWGFRSIGIFGEQGIGKTTVAKALFRRMSGGYDASRFVTDCNEKIVQLWSEEDYKEIPMEKFDLNDQDDEPCYRPKRVLVVLDDVVDAQNAEAFLSGFKRFGPGSLLIITSRDRQVLEQCHVNEIFELKGLNNDDALKLFTRCLFGEDVTEEKLWKFSVSAIEHCDGNPSTLRSYAEMIKGKLEMAMTLGRICHIEKSKPLFWFEETIHNFTLNLKQPFLLTATYNDQSFLEKLAELELSSRFSESMLMDLNNPYLDHDYVQNSSFCASSNLNDLCRLKPLPTSDQSIVNLGQESMQSLAQQFQRKQLIILKGFACQLNKLWRGYKSFSRLRRIEFGHFEKLVEVEAISEARNLEEIDLQDCISLERIPVTDQLKHLRILNLSGCTGIKHFPDIIGTIDELNLEGTGIIETRFEEKGFSKLAKQQSTATLELTRRA